MPVLFLSRLRYRVKAKLRDLSGHLQIPIRRGLDKTVLRIGPTKRVSCKKMNRVNFPWEVPIERNGGRAGQSVENYYGVCHISLAGQLIGHYTKRIE